MLRDLTESELAGIRGAIERDGIVQLPDMVPPPLLDELQRFVLGEAAAAAPCDFSRRDGFACTVIGRLVQSPELRRTMAQIYCAVFGCAPPSDAPFRVLRVIAWQPSQRHAHNYHFDAYRLTVLLPIFIPDRHPGENGDLLLLPELRRAPRGVLVNALQKMALQNRLAWAVFALPGLCARLGGRSARLQPGSLHVFRGFTTYHANERCHPGSLRATLLLHLDDPFEKSRLLAFVKRRRARWDERRRARRLAAT